MFEKRMPTKQHNYYYYNWLLFKLFTSFAPITWKEFYHMLATPQNNGTRHMRKTTSNNDSGQCENNVQKR
jgi:hypothetical protein